MINTAPHDRTPTRRQQISLLLHGSAAVVHIYLTLANDKQYVSLWSNLLVRTTPVLTTGPYTFCPATSTMSRKHNTDLYKCFSICNRLSMEPEIGGARVITTKIAMLGEGWWYTHGRKAETNAHPSFSHKLLMLHSLIAVVLGLFERTCKALQFLLNVFLTPPSLSHCKR